MRATVPGVVCADAKVTISFAGRSLRCRPGDTVAAALLDGGEPLCRTTAGGAPRGVFCGMGVCHDCIVEVDGVPGRRACMTPVSPGMRIEPQPARPELTASAPPHALERRELAPQVLVIGGGPAGLAAAAVAAEAGLDVVLVDERAKLGGQYYKQPAGAVREAELDGQFRAGRALVERVHRSGARVLDGAVVWGAFAQEEHAPIVEAVDALTAWTLRPQRLVVAAGAYERAVPFPGWTLPGVMTAGAAQTLLRSHQVAPGRQVLVAGNGPLNMQVAAELARGGVDVVAVAELGRPAAQLRALAAMLAAAPALVRDGARLRATLLARRVPVIARSTVVRAEGVARVEHAVIARIDAHGQPVPGTERRYGVDAVCLGLGFLPSGELLRGLGCRHASLDVVTDSCGRTSVDSVWAIGDGAGIGGANLALAQGALAARDVARTLGVPAAEARRAERARRRHLRFQRALRRAYRAPPLTGELCDDETLVCRCEEVSYAAIRAAFDDGAEHIGAVKRVTRAGMGGCQGRYCGPLLAELSASRSGRTVGESDLFAPAAPFKPLPVAALAADDGA